MCQDTSMRKGLMNEISCINSHRSFGSRMTSANARSLSRTFRLKRALPTQPNRNE
jgi:hypothetical protein